MFLEADFICVVGICFVAVDGFCAVWVFEVCFLRLVVCVCACVETAELGSRGITAGYSYGAARIAGYGGGGFEAVELG